MYYAKGLLFSALMTAAATVLGGCGAGASPDKPRGAPPAAGAAKDAPGGAETTAGLAELDETDRAAAAKQRICPVSGELLGSMGKPYRVVVEGQTVFLCCSGCEEEIQRMPDKYLEKLKVAGAK